MTESLIVTVSAAQLDTMRAAISVLGRNVDGAIARAINHTGDKAKTAVTRALVAQTGLPRKTIVAFLRVQRAGSAKGTALYALRGRGGNISLKYFGARETPTGVSAAPLGQRMVFAGTFMKAGRFPNRVGKPNWNGQVFRRANGTTGKGEVREGRQRRLPARTDDQRSERRGVPASGGVRPPGPPRSRAEARDCGPILIGERRHGGGTAATRLPATPEGPSPRPLPARVVNSRDLASVRPI